ncbi:uncharacterized protein BP5553_10512 [Venustampulla echinocandica]|uniref:Zn(2)-C6 fungal-type domain-containing protein n=1 Tax=Venustampulla echinocandica TaxID=2656787 RepID=A0A370T9I1_9HELO|nr:uncharacterized protein BP5553_10512 [Venustampulla echinocandica]RDL30234.1 hypothetical protein BP5553_10512 [Venustampulla echinocandica]
MASTCPTEFPERRTRRRSRFGCRNCKLRKLKCDEGKPQCKRCGSFGVLCNFKPNTPDLQPVADDSVRSLVVRERAELRPPLTSGVWTSDASTFYQLNAKCQDLANRYLGRGLITPDDPNMIEVNRKLLILAFTHPFLMHASLAVALAYDRYLNSPLSSRRTPEECYHWYQTTALFNRRLREPIETKDKDPIWGTAAALVMLTFSTPDSYTPEESWPLKPSGPSDLEWLRMSKGKMSLWRITDPLRPDSLFRVMAPTYAQMNSPLPEKGIDGITRGLAIACHLEDSSTAENNPYFNAAHAVSQLQGLPDSQVITGQTELFTRSIRGAFKSLLQEKDPVALLLLYLWYRKAGRELDIPRVGPRPGLLGNTTKSYFHSHSLQLIQEGYARYKDGMYLLWTTDMDRVIVSRKFMKDFSSLSRSELQVTATMRHAGEYTRMDVVEKGLLGLPVYDETLFALNKILERPESKNGIYTLPLISSMIQLVTSVTARVFVGPDLCRDPDWLSTATGYTMDVFKVMKDLKAHYRVFHPFVAPFLASCRQIRNRFAVARKLLLPRLENRTSESAYNHNDMLQWLIDTARGHDAETDQIVKRMLFLNMAAIHTSAETAANTILDLCARPEDMAVLREEMLQALKTHDGLKLATLSSLKKTGSFIKGSSGLNTLGLMTFNRRLTTPLTLSNGVTLPASTYISMPHYPMMHDADLFPPPKTFDGLRFFNLRQEKGQEERHQFASLSSEIPSWGVGKFACPGRFRASAQIKLIQMILLLEFEIAYPDGQTERPKNVIVGEKNQVSMSQKITLKRRSF